MMRLDLKPVPPTDPEGRDVDLGRGPVHIVDEGEGPAVIMCHGIPGSVRDFRYLGPELKKRGLRGIRFDWPGFGNSPLRSFHGVESRNRAAFIVRLADVLGIDRFCVVGHSFGGSPAMLTAALFKDRVWGLGLINSVGVNRHRAYPAVPKKVVSRIADGLDTPLLSEVLTEVVRAAYRRRNLKDDFDAKKLAHHARLASALEFADHRWATREVECESIVASSEDDPLVEPEVSHSLMSSFGDQAVRRHLHVREGGHYLQKVEAPRIAVNLVEMATRAGEL